MLVLFFLPLGQLSQLPIKELIPFFDLPSLSVRIYIHDIFISFFILFTVIHKRDALADALTWLRQQKIFLGLVLLIGISASYAALITESPIPLLYIIRILTYLSFLGLIQIQFSNQKLMHALVVVSLSFYAWLGMLQFILLPDVRFLAALGWDDHYYRMTGTLFDPNFTGSLLIMLFWGVVVLRNTMHKWPWSVMLTTLILLISVTYSRASYLAFFVSGACFLFLTKIRISKRLLVGVLSLLLVSWAIIPKPGGEGVNLLRTVSITARIEHSILPLQHLSFSEWLIGAGLFTHPSSQQVWVPDNIIVLIISGSGLVGLGLVAALGWQYWKQLRQQPALAAIWIGALTHSQFNNTLLEPFHVLYLGIITIALWKQPKD